MLYAYCKIWHRVWTQLSISLPTHVHVLLWLFPLFPLTVQYFVIYWRLLNYNLFSLPTALGHSGPLGSDNTPIDQGSGGDYTYIKFSYTLVEYSVERSFEARLNESTYFQRTWCTSSISFHTLEWNSDSHSAYFRYCRRSHCRWHHGVSWKGAAPPPGIKTI